MSTDWHTYVSWRPCTAVPVKNHVRRYESFTRDQIKDVVKGITPQAASSAEDNQQKFNLTTHEKDELNRLTDLQYACRLDGILLYRFRVGGKDAGGATMDVDNYGFLIESIARLVGEILKLRLKHYHDFHWDKNRHIDLLAPSPVRVADREEYCCSIPLLDEVKKYITERKDETGTGDEPETPEKNGLAGKRTAELVETYESLVFADDISNMHLIDVASNDVTMASLAAHRGEQRRESNDIRGPQYALLRYREGLSIMRRRCLQTVSYEKEWQRKELGLYTISIFLLWSLTAIFIVDTLLHMYGLTIKGFPYLIILLPVVSAVQYVRLNEDARMIARQILKNPLLWISLLIVALPIVILAVNGFGPKMMEPFSAYIMPRISLWIGKVNASWFYEAKSFLLVSGMLLTFRWLASSRWQHRPIMKVIRHTIGFYAHVNIYAHVVNGIYDRLQKNGEFQVGVNNCASDFGNIIIALEQKYRGHEQRERGEQNKFILTVSALAVLLAFLQLGTL